MIRYKVLQLLLLVSSMTSQVIGMIPQEIARSSEEVSSMPFQMEGIAQKIEELPKELQYKIFSPALALRENPKYEIYKKFDVGSYVTGIALTADNTKALIGLDDNVARIWDVEKGTVLKELKGHAYSITSVALSADDSLALTGSYDATARVWDMNTGELLKTLQVGSFVHSVALSANGTLALIGSDDGIARLYTSTGELLKELKGHTKDITSVALSADGTLALTGSLDKTARVWNALTGGLIKTLQVGSDISSVALSADGTLAVIGCSNYTASGNKAQVWDVKEGVLLNTLLTTSQAASVAVSKDGKRALVGTTDGNIQVWNTKPLPGKAETSTPLTVLKGHTQSVRTVAFGGADFIASGSYDKTALIWKPYALEPRAPQEHEEILRQAYKETFSRPILRSAMEAK